MCLCLSCPFRSETIDKDSNWVMEKFALFWTVLMTPELSVNSGLDNDILTCLVRSDRGVWTLIWSLSQRAKSYSSVLFPIDLYKWPDVLWKLNKDSNYSKHHVLYVHFLQSAIRSLKTIDVMRTWMRNYIISSKFKRANTSSIAYGETVKFSNNKLRIGAYSNHFIPYC